MGDEDPRPNLGRLFLNSFRWLDVGFRARMAGLGYPDCPRSTSLVFPYILESGARSADIARQAGVSRQAVHEVVEDLRARGLVELQPDPSDGRARLVMLTEQGRRFDDAIGEAIHGLERELGKRLGRRRLTALREALEADWGEPLTDHS